MSVSPVTLSPAMLLGRAPEQMTDVLGCPVHPAIVAPFRRLQRRAVDAGFDLQIVSGFRDFYRQLAIWNAKATGQRPLLDAAGCPLEFARLDETALIEAIMRWSALPGASRHHWGTDIDVFDAAAVAPDYQVQLSPQEVAAGGPFAPLHDWLDEQFARGAGEGFFRPYQVDRGGIAPERWHLSYAPLARLYQTQLTPALLAAELAGAELALKKAVLPALDDLYRRYVAVPADAYPEAFAAEIPNQEEK